MVKAMPTESETLDSFISRERKRLQKAREDGRSRRQRVEDEITTIDRELKAMDAYHAVKHGESKRRTRRPSPGPRGSKRQQILELIKQTPDGLSRGDIINRLALMGNKSGEQSVSNASQGLKEGLRAHVFLAGAPGDAVSSTRFRTAGCYRISCPQARAWPLASPIGVMRLVDGRKMHIDGNCAIAHRV
jgi:hypothetical protein